MLCKVKLYVSTIMIYCARRKFLSGRDLMIALGTGTETPNNAAPSLLSQLHLPNNEYRICSSVPECAYQTYRFCSAGGTFQHKLQTSLPLNTQLLSTIVCPSSLQSEIACSI